MKALVTGAAGFIGSHLCERLLADGHEVIGIDDLSTGRISNIEAIKNHKSFHFFGGALGSVGLPACDWVFHLAAKADIVPSIERPMEYHETNVSTTLGLLEWARASGVKKFIYAASSSCYGVPDSPNGYPTSETYRCDPRYPYALTKYLGEQYVLHWSKVYGISAISLRLFNVYGPRSRTSGAYGAVFGVFLSQMANGAPITVVGDGTQTRDFTFVTDVVDAFVKAANSYLSGCAINIGSGGHYSVNYLADLLGATERITLPERPGEPKTTFAYTGLANSLLGWEPKVSFYDGVMKMKELIPQYKDAPLWTKESIEKATDSWFKFLGDKSVTTHQR